MLVGNPNDNIGYRITVSNVGFTTPTPLAFEPKAGETNESGGKLNRKDSEREELGGRRKSKAVHSGESI